MLAVPADGAYFGVAHEGMHTTEGGVEDWSRAHAGARPAIVHWFQQWGSGENRFREDWVRDVAAQGAVPMISWEPWAKPVGEYAAPEQQDFHLQRIIGGEFDTYIEAWAQAAAAYGDPIVIRFMHEFNGDWYPWSIGLNGQTPEMYVEAWRHVHAIFTAAGAVNVSWVWSPIWGEQEHGPAYPGRRCRRLGVDDGPQLRSTRVRRVVRLPVPRGPGLPRADPLWEADHAVRGGHAPGGR